MIIEFLVSAAIGSSLLLFSFFVAYISWGGKLPKLFPALKWKRLKKKDSSKPTTILANLIASKILSLPLTTENSLKSDGRTNTFTFRKTIKNIEIEYTQRTFDENILYACDKNRRTLHFSEHEKETVMEAIQKLQKLIKKQIEIDHLATLQLNATEAIAEFMGVDDNDINDK